LQTLSTSCQNKRYYKPKETLLLALEARVEAISGEFNSQAVIFLKYHHEEKVGGGVQLAGHCKHAVGISGHGEEAGGSGDGTVGGAGGDDIRGVQLAGSANILWAYATVGRKLGKRVMGNLEGWAESISGEFNSQSVSNTFWEYDGI
jgi:hypothetical protein